MDVLVGLRGSVAVTAAWSPNYRYTWLILLCLLLVTSTSCQLNNDSEIYRDAISINDYEVVSKGYGQSAIAFYVGPSRGNEELLTDVSGPELTLSRDDGFASADPRYVGHGYGYSEDTGECFVRLLRLEAADSTIGYIGERRLNAEQKAGILDGSKAVIRVGVVCERQADSW